MLKNTRLQEPWSAGAPCCGWSVASGAVMPLRSERLSAPGASLKLAVAPSEERVIVPLNSSCPDASSYAIRVIVNEPEKLLVETGTFRRSAARSLGAWRCVENEAP